MDQVNPFGTSFQGKKVLLTGHTGFKGSWLSLWLKSLGAEVYGFALVPETSPSMFTLCNVGNDIHHHVGDIRDYKATLSHIAAIKPDVVLHLAAQAIVRRSFVDPLETVATNVMGTAHVLEAVRQLDRPCAVVVVSSDKCYDNREWPWGYRENDPLGGKDPYSMSKGATELVAASWRDSYFARDDKVKLASARAGNVIGGGDWAQDRIVPDCIRAFAKGERVELRNPRATRPWQHVLEPLSGYLLLASRLLGKDGVEYCEAWNFGPSSEDVKPVQHIVDVIAKHWGGAPKWSMSPGPHPKEAAFLALSCDKAIQNLGWRPTWNIDTAIAETVSWFRSWHDGNADMKHFSLGQIAKFQSLLAGRMTLVQ